MKMVMEAVLFAEQRHSGQFRKGSGHPYASHPVAVSYLVAAYKRSKHLEELLAAAVLHDIMEDTSTTFVELAEKFSSLVASLVLELTNDPKAIAKLGKKEYQRRKLIGISSYALVIKLCDRLHNILDQPTESMVRDTQEIMKSLIVSRKLSKTQRNIVNAIQTQCDELIASFKD